MGNLESASSEDSDQIAHPRSLIRVFTGRSTDSQSPNDSSSGYRRLYSDCVVVQIDLSLRRADMPTCTLCCVPVRM